MEGGADSSVAHSASDVAGEVEGLAKGSLTVRSKFQQG